ncbi:MAG: hypothetical protein GOU97_01075 [Nanoarchaeota archaeon]|nr:hypothetical protein [Nanoarchaeota archaeon]
MLEDLIQISFTSIAIVLFLIILYNAFFSMIETNNLLLLQNTAFSLSNLLFDQFGSESVLEKQLVFSASQNVFISDYHYSLLVMDLETGEKKRFGEEFNMEDLIQEERTVVSITLPCLLKESGGTNTCKVVSRVWN